MSNTFYRRVRVSGSDAEMLNGGGHLKLDPKANPAAAEILAQPVEVTHQSLLGSINMTLLLR